jgi:hypothetical protein
VRFDIEGCACDRSIAQENTGGQSVRTKLLKASLAIAAATGASVIAAAPVSAAGKVKVIFCKKNGEEAYFKYSDLMKIPDKFCSLKSVANADFYKIKFSASEIFIKLDE